MRNQTGFIPERVCLSAQGISKSETFPPFVANCYNGHSPEENKIKDVWKSVGFVHENNLYCLQGGKRVPLEDFDIIHWARFLKHSSMWSYILFRILRSHDFNYDYSCSFLLYFIFLPWQPHSVIDSRYYCRVRAHMTARCSHEASLLRASLLLCSEWHNGHSP